MMFSKLVNLYRQSNLAAKIRYSYIVLIVPFVAFQVFCFYNMWDSNRQYKDMINSTTVASEFSIDFKEEFDYETYLLIVGNTTMEDSPLNSILSHAESVVSGLTQYTDSEENSKRLKSIKKYISNLGVYVERIEQNLLEGNRYEDNIEIWENDIQIVTSLVQDTIIEYIYYEMQGIEATYRAYQSVFASLIRTSLLIFAILVVISIALSFFVPRGITRPINELVDVTNRAAEGDLTVRSNITESEEAKILGDSINAMMDKINELLEQITSEQIRLRKAEFEILQSQINPHFLYNTLDAIIWLAESGEQKMVVDMVGSLSAFFRASLGHGKNIVTIRDELQHIESYLAIQKVRYQDILNYEISLPEAVLDYKIPKLTIQPIVENALYHGIKNKRGGGTIKVMGGAENDRLCITVTDDGIGIEKGRMQQIREKLENGEASQTQMFGMYNVQERIKLNFGEDYGLSIESEAGNGTTVTIKLPCVSD